MRKITDEDIIKIIEKFDEIIREQNSIIKKLRYDIEFLKDVNNLKQITESFKEIKDE